MSTLKSLRAEIKQALNEGGLNAVEYTEKLVPPCVFVIPDENYVLPTGSNNTFGEWNVGIRLAAVGPKGTTRFTADAIDDMIEKVLIVLVDQDVEITSVNAAQFIELNGVQYFAAIITIEIYLSNLGKEQ
jgi:hypothetical protein